MSHPSSLAPLIDHTLLNPAATEGEFRRLCDEARRYGFGGVYVSSSRIKFVAEQLSGLVLLRPSCVIGFPHGTMTTSVKANEAGFALRYGALGLGMVINIGWLKDNAHARVSGDIAAVVDEANGLPVEVIIETGLLTNHEKEMACRLAVDAGAASVNTCSGFNGGSATVDDIQLMRNIVGPNIGVKAFGSVDDYATAMTLIGAGADRLGTSRSIAIINGAPPTQEGDPH